MLAGPGERGHLARWPLLQHSLSQDELSRLVANTCGAAYFGHHHLTQYTQLLIRLHKKYFVQFKWAALSQVAMQCKF